MSPNTDSKLSPAFSRAAREEAHHRPLVLQKSPNGPLISGLAAALAMQVIHGFCPQSDRAGVRTMKGIAHATRVYFRALGVSFDDCGRPVLPAIAIDVSSAHRMHAEAAELAYRAIAAAVFGATAAGEEVDQWALDLASHASFVAFRDGATIDITLGDWELKREVHVLDRATGDCLGHLGLFR